MRPMLGRPLTAHDGHTENSPSSGGMVSSDPRNQGRRPPGYPRRPRKDNPLSRPSDRVRFWIDLLLLVVLVVGTPVAGLAAGALTYDHHLAGPHSTGQHQVTARLTANVRGLPPSAGPGSAVGTVPVRWTDHGGTHTGVAVAPQGQKKGTYMRIWVDRAERITAPPESPALAPVAGACAGVAAAGMTAALVGATRTRLHRSLDRRNYVHWEREWSTFEPLWSHRNGR